MTLVFTLYKYFPFGGLQKDMLAIAKECVVRGHQVSIFCRSWSGDYPENIHINILPVKALSNHGKNSKFAKQLRHCMQKLKPDLVVAFNKIPGADVYYAADTCFKAKLYRERPWVYRLLPRYRQYVRDEATLFGQNADTHILAISKSAIDEYRDYYQTTVDRFTLLPPGISREHINNQRERLDVIHRELGLTADKQIVLMVGSGFRTKGLDRAIAALASLPANTRNNTHLVVVGQDNPEVFIQQATDSSIATQLYFLGGRKDVPLLLRSADVLIHPAYRENTGTALLEAAVAGLPVITTDVCGYAHYIADNDLGVVLPSPFDQEALNKTLLIALMDTDKNKQWRNNCYAFAQGADIYSLPQKAVDAIEAFAKKSRRL